VVLLKGVAVTVVRKRAKRVHVPGHGEQERLRATAQRETDVDRSMSSMGGLQLATREEFDTVGKGGQSPHGVIVWAEEGENFRPPAEKAESSL